MKSAFARISVICLLAVLLAALLPACVAFDRFDLEITLKLHEEWSIQAKMAAPSGDAATVEQKINEILQKAKAVGCVGDYQQQQDPGGGVQYVVELSGSGYDKLNSILGENVVQVVDPERRDILFSLSNGQYFGTGSSHTITLSVENILDTNGVKLDAHTIVWADQSMGMTATVSELPLCPLFSEFNYDITILNKGNWSVLAQANADPKCKEVIENNLNQKISEGKALGAATKLAAKDNPDGSLNFKLELSAQGYDKLSKLINATFETVNSDKHLVSFSAIQATGIAGSAAQRTITLHAQEILTTNGVIKEKNTAIWVNHTASLEAMFVEPSGIPLEWLLIAAIVVVGALLFFLTILLVVVLVRRKSHPQP